LTVIANPPAVRPFHGGFAIIQPTEIGLRGVAQPPAPNVATLVEIFGIDHSGNLLNGGSPLAVTTPNVLGRYQTTVSLPSMIRKDINQLVAREVVIGSVTGPLTINATTLSGLNGLLAINGSTLSGFSGTITLNGASITSLTGSITNPGTTSTLTGTTGPIPGTVTGTITNPGSTSTLTGAGTIGAQSGTLTDGTGTISATTGTFTQSGTATIAATTGTATLDITEFAVSNSVTIFIHQSRNQVFPVTAAHAHAHPHARAADHAAPLEHTPAPHLTVHPHRAHPARVGKV
jgi:hypothetical protein